MKITDIASKDDNTHGGGEIPPSTGLIPDALPEVHEPVLAENSQTGVSTRNALSGPSIKLPFNEMGTNMIIGGLLTFLSSTPEMKMVEKTQGNSIVVHLNEIKEAQKVLEMVKIVNISFHDSVICIEGKIR